MKQGLLERLAAGPVICAEGYLFELERRGYLQAGAYVPEVVLDFPEQVENLHRDFLRAGSDVIEVISPHTEEVVGRVPEGTTADIDRAVQAARTAFDEGEWPRMAPLARRSASTAASRMTARCSVSSSSPVSANGARSVMPAAGP